MWSVIQEQILGMKWLNVLIGNLLNVLGLDTSTKIGGMVQFFIYDVIKITVLLCVLIFLIPYIQSFFPPERSRKIMGRFHGIGANIVGALLGTVTPFCSCSSIPIFMGFTSAGLPLGVTFSFLISSPMVDLGSLVLLISIFGVKTAVAYVVLGLVIAVMGGTMIVHLADLFVGYDHSLKELTVSGFRIYAISFMLIGYVIFTSGFFTVLGDGITSALISFIRTMILECTAVMLLPLIWGINGIWISVVAAESMVL